MQDMPNDGAMKAALPTSDIVILGGGLAGLFCALRLAPLPVTVVTAAPIGEGASTAWAQGGIAAAMAPGDSVESHLADTVAAGAGTVDEQIARIMVSEAAARVHDLLDYGVPFDRDLEGHLLMSREAAHSARRIVHVKGDMAGAAIMSALVAAVRKTPSIRVLEGYIGESLTMDQEAVSGIFVRPRDGGKVEFIAAGAIVLAVGGVGHLFEVTTNPVEAEGSGIGMASRAGAVIADAEFVQFHPTALAVGRDPAPLLTEALRGEGATLVNSSGERFMLKVHPLAELAPRDIVARAVHGEIAAGRGAFLDCREAIGEDFAEEFPTVYRHCRDAGIDPAHEVIPVAPAEHYHMGGLLTDAGGRTSLDGLWACGETASTGAHGANRLASNSLLEAVVFATRVADDIKTRGYTTRATDRFVPAAREQSSEPAEGDIALLRKTMSRHVGVVRDQAGLLEALSVISRLEKECRSTRFLNMLVAAKHIAAAALTRTESRGGHYRSDFPESDPAWRHRSFLTLADVERIASNRSRERVSAPVA
jgi:L-aspartate oxidase